MARIMITGSRGLIGRALARALTLGGHRAVGFDAALPKGHAGRGDVRDSAALARALGGRGGESFDDQAREPFDGPRREPFDGVVHLAAVSRVAWGQRDPDLCRDVNEAGTKAVLRAALEAPGKPWVLIASSREVYGEPERLPVREDDALAPANAYGRSKLEAERLAWEAREAGLALAVARYANVYGAINDHLDRAAPAFARAAAEGSVMAVRGSANAFDFTHVDDVARGTVALVEALIAGESSLPPVHFAAGRPVTLGELAAIAAAASAELRPHDPARVEAEPPAPGFVSRFVGDPARAEALLGWRAKVAVEDGVRQLARDFAEAGLLDRQNDFPGELAPAGAFGGGGAARPAGVGP